MACPVQGHPKGPQRERVIWIVAIASMLEAGAQAFEGALQRSWPAFVLWLTTAFVVGSLAAWAEGLKAQREE